MNNNPTEIANGLRRLADLLEKMDANAPRLKVVLDTSWVSLQCAVQLAAIANDADRFDVDPFSGGKVNATWDGLQVEVVCPVEQVAHTQPRIFSLDELTERANKADRLIAEGPF